MKFERVWRKEIPPGMRVWASSVGKYSFVISYEDGTMLKPEAHAEWRGYTASWKDNSDAISRLRPATRISGLFQTFDEATRACKTALIELRRAA